MSNPIASVPKLPEIAPSLAQTSGATVGGTAPAAASVSTAAAQPAASAPEDVRLVIEDDKAAGCFVYKVIDRKTGTVVQQTPSAQIVKLRESDGYLAGDVIKAQV
jgi:hypothetical protein